jgi:hypothetical protein
MVCVLAMAGCASSRPTVRSSVTTTTAAQAKVPVDPCVLLPAAEASALAARRLTRSGDDRPGSGGCSYTSADAAVTAEILLKADPDDAFAQADYPAWVKSVVSAPGFKVTPLRGPGDSATLIQSESFDAILFRHGNVLVKIGAGPKATPAALKVAANRAIRRLGAAR